MWLASFSRRDRFGSIIPTTHWGKHDIHVAEVGLLDVLDGVGDESRERFLALCISAQIQRAVTDAELAKIGDHCPPRDLAGAPLRVFRQRGIVDTPSIQPCHNPGKNYIDHRLWLPAVDCGSCPPCLARAALSPSGGAR